MSSSASKWRPDTPDSNLLDVTASAIPDDEASAHDVPDADVPIVDLSGWDDGNGPRAHEIARELGEACHTIGFVLVSGHGVSETVTDEFFAVSREFFELPLDEKLRVKSPNDLLFQGYACPGDGPGYHTSERQSFNVYRYDTAAEAVSDGFPPDVGAVMYDALWPARPERFAAVWREYFAEMDELAAKLLRAFELGLGLADGWFGTQLRKDPSTQAANYYSFDIDSGHEPSAFRFKAHLDSDVFTMLYQDDGPGSLQLYQRDSGWRNVAPVAGTYVVNIGEVMARWTNDRLVATPHRVLAPVDPGELRPRMSAPFFLKPDLDATVGPIPELLEPGEVPRYPTMTGREWLLKLQVDIDSGYDTTEQFAERAEADPSLR